MKTKILLSLVGSLMLADSVEAKSYTFGNARRGFTASSFFHQNTRDWVEDNKRYYYKDYSSRSYVNYAPHHMNVGSGRNINRNKAEGMYMKSYTRFDAGYFAFNFNVRRFSVTTGRGVSKRDALFTWNALWVWGGKDMRGHDVVEIDLLENYHAPGTATPRGNWLKSQFNVYLKKSYDRIAWQRLKFNRRYWYTQYAWEWVKASYRPGGNPDFQVASHDRAGGFYSPWTRINWRSVGSKNSKGKFQVLVQNRPVNHTGYGYWGSTLSVAEIQTPN